MSWKDVCLGFCQCFFCISWDYEIILWCLPSTLLVGHSVWLSSYIDSYLYPRNNSHSANGISSYHHWCVCVVCRGAFTWKPEVNLVVILSDLSILEFFYFLFALCVRARACKCRCPWRSEAAGPLELPAMGAFPCGTISPAPTVTLLV